MSAPRVLLQRARLAVFQPTGPTTGDIRAWLANQNYFLDVDLQPSTFALRPSDSSELTQALANDINRLSTAAFESAAGVGVDSILPRSLAWGSIRTYYASFFAAHGLMRLFGTACTQLDAEHVDAVHNTATAFGRAGAVASLEAGFYVAEIDASFARITFRKLKDSHRDTWSTLLTVIDELIAAIPGTTALGAHKLEAVSLLSALRDGLTRANCVRGNWLSLTRNSINYRLSHHAWYPYSSKAASSALLTAVPRGWLQPPVSPSAGGDLEAYMQIATMVVSLLRELIVTAADMAQPTSPVFRNGCVRLLNDVQAARAQQQNH